MTGPALPRSPADLASTAAEAALDAVEEALLVVGPRRRILLWNRAFVTLWGIPLEVLGSGDDDGTVELMRAQMRDPALLAGLIGGDPNASTSAEPSRKTIALTDGRVLDCQVRLDRLDQGTFQVWAFRNVTDQHRAAHALDESERRYRRLFHDSRHALYVTSASGDFLDMNQAGLDLFGYSRDELLERNALDFYDDAEDRERFQRVIGNKGSVRSYEVRLRSSDGRVMDCLLTTTARRAEDGSVIGYEGIIEDVTEKKKQEAALRRREAYFRSLIERAQDTITVLEGDGRIRYQSPSVSEVLGWSPDEVQGRSILDCVHPDDRALAYQELGRVLDAPGESVTVELRVSHRDGSYRSMEAVGRNLLDDPDVAGIVVNARDVTERRAVEEQLHHDVFHDKLTGLPNRALFMDRLDQLLRREKREAEGFAILFLDLDRFKVVNDSLGHMVGDELLASLARRLESCLRPGDTVARLGGDEFTMLLEGVSEVGEAEAIADRVHEKLKKPFHLMGHEVFITVSIGIALSNTADYDRPENVLRNADLAMYRVKTQGRSGHAVYDADMRGDSASLLNLETDLHRALERGEFTLRYQPIVRLSDLKLQGFEALIRWEHPERGLLVPDDFLFIAEDTGLIEPMGWWVLEEACAQLKAWPSADAFFMQVNLATRQLLSRELLERVEDALTNHELEGQRLRLELTEGALMTNPEMSVRLLRRLKELGVQLSIDDFGIGYSSLSYLHRFAADLVKIDRSFTNELAPDGSQAGIVRTIVELAHDLEMEVVAEGVETREQLERFRELGAEYGQGFHFSPARSPHEIQSLMDSPLPWTG